MRLNLVLLGDTGFGKSSSGNTILGETLFYLDNGVTLSRSRHIIIYFSKRINGRKITVIDNERGYDEEFRLELERACQGGLTVYLLVLMIGRFTEGNRDMLERVETALKTRIRDRTIILFTHGDALGSQHIDDYVRNSNTHLQSLIRECGNRYQVFNNKDRDEGRGQVEELMGNIDELLKGIYGDRYQVRNSNKLLQSLIRKCGGRYQVLNNKSKGRGQVEELMGNVDGLVKSGDYHNDEVGKGMCGDGDSDSDECGCQLENRDGWRQQVKQPKRTCIIT